MKAHEGDWLLVKSHRDDHHSRRAEIVKVGPDGAPPYTVRWADDNHEGVMYPGPDAEIVTAERLAELDRIQHQRI